MENNRGHNWSEQTEASSDRMLSKLAANLFIRASVLYPASVTAQAACIAQDCLSKNMHNPYALLHPLLEDTDRLTEIVDAANARHFHANNGPVDTKGKLTMLDTDSIRGIIQADFKWAEILSELPQEKITEILGKYDTFRKLDVGKKDTFDAYDWYNEFTDEILLDHFGARKFKRKVRWVHASERYSDREITVFNPA